MKKFILILSFFLSTSPLLASEITVKKANRLILEVDGIVCSFCGYGMSKKLSKLGFVDKDVFEKGVFTNLKKGLVTLALKPDKKIDVSKIKKKIKEGGYKLKGTHLRLEGPISKSNEATTLQNKRNNQTFVLVDSNGKPWKPTEEIGQDVTIQGFIGLKAPFHVQVKP